MNELVKQKKNQIISAVVEDVNNSSGVFFSEYRGLTSFEMNQLRKSLKDSNGKVSVVKNSLLKRVSDENDFNFPIHVLNGPTGIVYAKNDASKVAKILCSFKKTNPNLVIKGGIVGGIYIDAKDVTELSKLPSKEQLIAQFIGGLKSNITRLVVALNSPINGLVYTLDAIKKQKNK